MDANTIHTLCRWFSMSEADYFRLCYEARYGEPQLVEADVEEYVSCGAVPFYVRWFTLTHVYPALGKGGKDAARSMVKSISSAGDGPSESERNPSPPESA